MRRIYRLLTLLLGSAALAGAMSCSSDDNDSTVATTTSCFVNAAVLGGINCTLHTTASDGSDSTYTAVLTGGNYPLSIDHLNGRIYLQDSLPKGCDISRVTFSTFTYKGRAIAIRSLTTASDTVFNASDSTDCSLPRLITVYGYDGTTRSYTLELKVHGQSGDEMDWTRVATSDEVAALADQRLLSDGDALVLFGRSGSQTVKLTSTDDGATWARDVADTPVQPRSVQLVGGNYFALDANGNVASSTDGLTWTITSSTQQFDALAGGTDMLFGLTADAIYYSADGTAWTPDELDTDAAPLPATEIACAALPSRYEDVLLCGVASTGDASLWRRTLAPEGRYTFPWNNLIVSADVAAYPTALGNVSLVVYDDAPLLCGLAADGTLPALYISRDRGRTWLTTEIDAPALAAATSLSAATDDAGYLYLCAGGSGEVWRGCLARLAWKEVQTSYYKIKFKRFKED